MFHLFQKICFGTHKPINLIMKLNKLQFHQVNLHRCKAAIIEVNQSIPIKGQTIILIQEPYVKNNRIKNFNLNKFNLFSKVSQNKPRTCILATKDTELLLLSQLSTEDLTVASLTTKVNGGSKQIIIASGYMPSERHVLPPTPEVINLINHCKSNNVPLILGCDANAHHTVWGSTDVNEKGDSLFEFIMSSNLTVLNRGAEFTFYNTIREEILDVTLATMTFAHVIKDWKVTNEILLSDHRCISFHILTDKVERITFRNPANTDWNKFLESVAESIPSKSASINSISELDRAAKDLMDLQIRCFNDACPPKTYRAGRSASFFTGELKDIRKQTRRAFNRAKDKNPLKIAVRRKLQNIYSKMLRRSKRTKEQQLINSINTTAGASSAFKSLAKDPICSIGTLKKPSGEFTETAEATLHHLLETHFPKCALSKPTTSNETPLAFLPPSGLGDLNIAREIVTKDKVTWAVKSFSPFKSAGEDGIFPAILQNCIECTIDIIVELFLASIHLQHIPISWRGVRVVFIPKLGQESYMLAKSFRPISLTSFLLKTLEKLIDRYLRDGALKRSPLHIRQYAYQANKSAETALHHLVSKIEKAYEFGEIALGCFIDIDGAFNNMIFNAIAQACREHGIVETIIGWIVKMLRDRIIITRLGSAKVRVFVTQGCPQGGVLPPLLYCLVKDGLLNLLNNSGYYSQSFSDDLSILLTGICINTLSGLMQSALNLVQSWCISKKQTANPDKTKIVLFSRKKLQSGYKPPKFFGKQIHLSDFVKHLGVYLEPKGYFNLHVKIKIKKIISKMTSIK